MVFKPSRIIKWQVSLLLLLVVMLLVACRRGDEKGSVPEGCDDVTWGSSVEVEERDGDFYAIVQGDYPDSCSTLCGTEQEVDGNTINLNLYSDKPEDVFCSQMLTPFEEEVLIDTKGLDSGEYIVTVNGDHAMTTFSLP